MEALAAGFWGFVGGASLLVGAFVGLYAGVPQRVIAIVMAMGAVVLVSSVAFELMVEAYEEGGHLVGIVTTIGFLIAFLLSRME
jgi:zinc transporter, ZIP family